MCKINWFFLNVYVLGVFTVCFKLKSPVRSEKVMVFKAWLLKSF